MSFYKLRGGTGMSEEGNKKLTIIAFSGDLDKAYPTLILATTAASMGWGVTVFFTFWGLFILKRNEKFITGKDWMTKMLSMMNRGGTEHLKLSMLHMGGMGTGMLRKVFKKNQIASLDELLEMAIEMGVQLLPCQMTMDALGLKQEDLIEGVAESCGAATALTEMAESDVSLFI